MANIQSSLNQMLAAAQSGVTSAAWIYQQTPEYQLKKEEEIKQSNIKSLKTERARQEEEEAELNKILEDPTENKKYNDLTAESRFQKAAKRSDELDADIVKNQFDLYRLTGDKQYFNSGLKYMNANLREEAAAQSTLNSQQRKTSNQRNQTTEVENRYAMLKQFSEDKTFSSKERGQFSTAYNRHLKKGDFK